MITAIDTKQLTQRIGLAVSLSLALLAAVFSTYPTTSAANIFAAEEPLAPELVFVPEIAAVDEQEITLSFTIEDGYYLYRDKLGFTATDPGRQDEEVVLGAALFEAAGVIEDDFFGKQAIFREATQIRIPYTRPPGADSLMLAVKFQGCADLGLCYPPISTTLTVDLPPAGIAETFGATDPASGLFGQSLANTLQSSPLPSSRSMSGPSDPTITSILNPDDTSDELLPPELAYLPQIVNADRDAISLNWFIEDGYYLYRDKFSFTLEHTGGLQIATSTVSEGIETHDEFFGNVEILRNTADTALQLTSSPPLSNDAVAGSDALLTITYQGCADIGVCFPPTTASLPVSFSDAAPTAAVMAAVDSSVSPPPVSPPPVLPPSEQTESSPTLPMSEQDRLSGLLGSASLWLTVATFFGLGLLLAFTPCVLPMIPILSSLIVGQSRSITTWRAFQLSLIYVLVMASTYAVVGVLVGLSGYNIQPMLQQPAVLTAIAVLFVILSLSMFGFYELQMPAAVQSKLTRWSNKQGGGQVGGVAAMGFISTLIVGPCVTAPLAGALIFIAKTGDAVVGGSALFALGLGMGAPLLLIGTSAGKWVPKTGAWMNSTKQVFGILLLGMAIYMVSRFLPATTSMTLYAVLAIMSGVFLGATDTLSQQSSGWQRLGKGAGMVASAYGVALLAGALAGGGSYTAPLRAFANTGSSQTPDGVIAGEHALPFQTVKSVDDLQNVVLQAQAQGRPVMLDFYADWCISCKEMEAFVFTDPRVQDLLNTAIVVQADVTANDAQDQELLKAFELFGPPGIIFYDAQGTELRAARVVGFMNADDFSNHITRFIYNTEA